MAYPIKNIQMCKILECLHDITVLVYCYKMFPTFPTAYEERAQLSKETKVSFFLLLFPLYEDKKAVKVTNVVSNIIHKLGKCISVKIIQLTGNFQSLTSAFMFIIRQHLLGGLCE